MNVYITFFLHVTKHRGILSHIFYLQIYTNHKNKWPFYLPTQNRGETRTLRNSLNLEKVPVTNLQQYEQKIITVHILIICKKPAHCNFDKD